MTAINQPTLLKTLLIGTLLGVSAGAAIAQQPPSAPAEVTGLEEIIVYAQKKSVGETLQKVPIAEMAISGLALDQEHIQDLTQIGRLMPNVDLGPTGTFPLYPVFHIRGVGNTSSTASVDPAVNISQDGMVLGYQAGTVLDAFDMESVEVLRGPQGVLFGRNASGGAVVLRTPLPTADFSGDADLTIGNANTAIFKGDVSGPLVGDKILGKIALMTNDNTGLYENTTGGTFVPAPLNPCGCSPQHRTGGVGETHEIIVKPTLLFNMTDDAQLKLFTQYQQANVGAGATRAVNIPGAPALPVQTLLGYTPSNAAYTDNLVIPGGVHLEEEHAIAELDLDHLWGGALTTTAAYRRVIYDGTANSDGTPFSLVIFPDNVESNHQYSIESRYNKSIGDQFNYLLGVFVYDSEDAVREQRALNGIAAGKSFDTTVDQLTVWSQIDKTAALYSNVDYSPIHDLTLSAGLRYGYEAKQFEDIPLAACTGTPFVGCRSASYYSARHWYSLDPRFVVSYQLDPDHLIYASISKGSRAGNYNGRAITPEAAMTPANPETVLNYEVGTKNEFFGRRLRINLTGFYEVYHNLQENVLITFPDEQPVLNLANAASADVYGLELETSLFPIPQLRLDFNAGALHSHYNSFAGAPAGTNVSELRFDDAPNFTMDIAGTYTLEVPGLRGRVEARVEYHRQTAMFTSGDVYNTLIFEQPAYGILDASMAYVQGDWRISAFGRNIQNTVFNSVITRGLSYYESGGQPRTYGVEVSYRFGKHR